VLRPGGLPRRVAAGGSPSWGPGGHVIVFLGSGGVRRKQVGASGPGRLLARGGLVYEPTWSPNGRRIAYRRNRRLRLIGARRGRPVPVAFNPPGTDFSNAWQPLPQ
jgi:hypothetical protein